MSDVVARYYAALNAHDTSSYEQLFTPQAELVTPGRPVAHGVDAVRAFDTVFITAFPQDMRIETTTMAVAGDTVLCENIGSGTHLGPLAGPEGDIPPTGRFGTLRYVGAFTVRDGRIASQRIYWETSELLAALGLLPAGV